jgi:predicted nucleic acid-binding protein
MAVDRLFLDTGFVVARFNRRDQYHQAARRLAETFDACRELWTTEGVLLEVGAAFRETSQRAIVGRLWDQFHGETRYRLVSISGSLLERAMDLFRKRPDKQWSLCDCASFVLMGDEHLTDALSCDHHFLEAGFRALMLE